jgi:hypothetical protein
MFHFYTSHIYSNLFIATSSVSLPEGSEMHPRRWRRERWANRNTRWPHLRGGRLRVPERSDWIKNQIAKIPVADFSWFPCSSSIYFIHITQFRSKIFEWTIHIINKALNPTNVEQYCNSQKEPKSMRRNSHLSAVLGTKDAYMLRIPFHVLFRIILCLHGIVLN